MGFHVGGQDPATDGGRRDRSERLVEQYRPTHALDPECLPVYFALYEFYFYKSRLTDFEQAARQALDAAARRGGFPADWTKPGPDTADWADASNPAHFYLFSLEAPAFIRLRRGARDPR